MSLLGRGGLTLRKTPLLPPPLASPPVGGGRSALPTAMPPGLLDQGCGGMAVECGAMPLSDEAESEIREVRGGVGRAGEERAAERSAGMGRAGRGEEGRHGVE